MLTCSSALRRIWLTGLIGIAGCGGEVVFGEPDTTEAGDDAEARGDTATSCPDASDYAAVAPIIARACLPCHSVGSTGAARLGAPVGVDFDTEADLVSHADRVIFRAVHAGTMPPGAPLPSCEQDALEAWFEALPCQPACEGRACGDDGCGGVCGSCEPGAECDAVMGTCVACEARCDGKVCGNDGCGGSCGACAGRETCVEGACVCVPDCDGRVCGDDGCGGSCGGCGAGEVCGDGVCGCVPVCDGKVCGPDGCGGSCGECPGALVCQTTAGQCAATCTPSCEGQTCGDDGCGGSCGACASPDVCLDGQCACAPSCAGLACGDDGCGGSCGSCPEGHPCEGGQCSCDADCAGKACGADGCGGSCGTCGGGTTCGPDGQCVCQPACSGKACGPDGCGGVCGACAGGDVCATGACVTPPSFGAVVYPMFKAECTGACHSGVKPAEGLDLSTAAKAHADLVGVSSGQCASAVLVVPGDPAASYLVKKLLGSGMCFGSRMPKGGPFFTAAQMQLVEAWILGGAAND